MRAVSLHLFPRPAGISGDDFRLGYPSLSAEERIVLWRGLAPAAGPTVRGLAPVVLEGEDATGRVYAEQVPVGLWLAEALPPSPLRAFVTAEILDALVRLHETGEVHGAVGPERIVLGLDGSVVLVGRGRIGGRRQLDVFAALSLFPEDADTTLGGADAHELAEEARSRAGAGDRERLAAWVRAERTPRIVDEHTVVLVAEEGDAVDEVVPYLGPDRTDGRGILDRWAATTTSGGDITDEVSNTSPAMSLTLWNLLSAPPRHPPDPQRFAGVLGHPSRALVSLLAEEPPGLLPAPVAGRIEPFVIRAPMVEDLPTMVGETPRTFTPTVAVTRPSPPAVLQWVLAMSLGGLLAWIVLRALG